MTEVAELGTFALLAAFVVACFGLAATALALRRSDEGRRAALREAGERAVHAYAAFILLAAISLWAALLSRQFGIRFVADVTSSDLPRRYTIAAFWGGHAGSLLLWALVLAGYALAAQRALRGHRELAPYVTLVLLATGAFFGAALAFGSDPFARLAVPPPDGRGLNPLLRNPWMAAHPPALYLGFVGMTVPYALAVGALATGTLDDRWTRLARRWVLTSWLFLTTGLLFGAKWSYVVLGWGGYWAWDPVENAALMPWLTATAFLHSIQVHERATMARGWTAALMILSFGLALFGTFLTRSGLLSSVHAFAESSIGIFLLGFLAAAMVVGFGLLLWRLPALRGEAHLVSVLSREAALLANNVLLVVAAFAVLLGTIFPILAEAVTGDRLSVGPPYFTQVLAPVLVLVLGLMAAGPLLPWREGRGDALARSLAAPAAGGVLAALGIAALGVRSGGVLAVLALCVAAAGTVLVEFRSGVRGRAGRGEGWLGAVVRLVAGNQRRYAGYIVHAGLLLLLAGIIVSGAFSTAIQAAVAPGQSLRAGPYEVRYDGVTAAREGGRRVTTATVTVRQGTRTVAVLRPRHVRHAARDEVTADVAIRTTWQNDLYVVLMGVSPQGRATFRISVHPMMVWLWAGALVMLLGGVVAALPLPAARAVQRRAVEPAPVAGGGR